MIASISKKDAERFWAKVNVRSNDECWNWTAGTVPFGYGSFGWKGGITAHRFSWLLAHGEIPGGLCVLHKCDNPKCVNLAHLFLGTREDNCDDMWGKGRGVAFDGQPGEANSQAKLTEQQVVEIRARYRRGIVTQRMLAAEFGVERGTIKDVLRGRIWKHLPGASVNRKKGKPSNAEVLQSSYRAHPTE